MITEKLTKRQQQVYDLLLTDKSYSEIAECLNITISGVRQHCISIYNRLCLTNRLDLLCSECAETRDVIHPDLSSLTDFELDVYYMLVKAYQTSEMMNLLNKNEAEIRYARLRVFKKLNVKNVFELVRLVYRERK